MREQAISQAAGLMDLATRGGARLMAMVCHGDEHAELPLLWGLCASLSRLNYQVTVLDGTQSESMDNPGLEQVLDYSYWQDASTDSACPWHILPARQGLHTLASTASASWNAALQWGPLCAPNALTIVYAPAELLQGLAAQSGVTPVLALSSGTTSLMTSYLALKRLLINTGRVPTIAHVHARQHAAQTAEDSVARSLQDCARQFLQVEVDIHPLHLGSGPAQAQADMAELAQYLLDESVTLDPPWNGMRSQTAYGSHGLATRIS
jgi:hypothetical protein